MTRVALQKTKFYVHGVFNGEGIKTGNTSHPAGTQATDSSKAGPHRGITRFFEIIESIFGVKQKIKK